jgi:spore maturation protein CgeB
VWIGNWGDGDRTTELMTFLIEPIKKVGLSASLYGVRYPAEALASFKDSNIHYMGWLPNYRVPEVFSRFRLTAHVPRRPYSTVLPGIPTIRVFEALACGIPLVSAPWSDTEGLFTPGKDFLMARNRHEMTSYCLQLASDQAMAKEIMANGLATIRARHTCAHRVNELIAIWAKLTGTAQQ